MEEIHVGNRSYTYSNDRPRVSVYMQQQTHKGLLKHKGLSLRHHLFQVKYKMCKVNLPKINILDLLSLLDRYQPSWFPEPVAVPVSITWALK